MKRCFSYLLMGLMGLGLVIFTSSEHPIKAAEPSSLTPSVTATTATSDRMAEGRSRYTSGQFAEAADLWQKAAMDFEGRGDRFNQALALSYLSLAYQELNQWDKAQQSIEQSLSLLQTPGMNTEAILLAQASNTQASLLLHVGQAEAALATWEKAQQYYQQAGDPEGVLGSQINQAKALQTLGFYRRSKQLLEGIQAQLVELPDSTLKVSGLRNLGVVLQVIGDLQESRVVLEQSLAIAQNLNLTPELSTIFLSLGKTEADSGQVMTALADFQEAEKLAVSPLDQLQARLNQLNLYVDYVNEIPPERWYPVEALSYDIYQQLQELPASHLSVYAAVNLVANISRLEESKQPIQQDKLAKLLASAVQSAKALKDARAEAYALGQWGQMYARTQQWSDATNLTQQSLDIAQQIDAKDITSQSAWQLGRVLAKKGKQEEAIAAYTQAVTALQALRGDLVAINPDVQFSFRESVEPVYRELVALLLDDSPSQDYLKKARGLIEALQVAELDNFFREACLDVQPQQIDQLDAGATVIYPIILGDRLAVIASSANQPLHFHQFRGSQIEINTTLRNLLASLHPVADNAERLKLSQQVYDWLIRPAEAEGVLKQTKTLVFVLDGLLRKIPISALHDGEKYLIEKYGVSLSPGLQLMAARSLNEGHLKAIVGGISESREGFAALPAVEAEVNDISQLVPAATLLNQQFTSQALENRVTRSTANIVHLATHGQFSSRQEDTFLLTWEGRMNVKELSRLLQSRANNQAHPIDLLVLSACDTASGDDRATLGLAGFAVKSGARSTLATLWPVKDKAAALLMTRFYEHLRETQMTKAEALRQAQVELITQTDYTHPFFWSAFVLVGNWL
ncbi:MAG: CHAT domain-containing protein [Oculatellaceae cyanobacterium Prado106]|nr:CHAT domain-containing protein [Oculatellaceae cyanobacterium Prado106]